MSEHNPSREVDVFGNQLCGCGDRYPCPTVILTDLIADLWDHECDAAPEDCSICDTLDRAEARLKGLSNE